MDLCELWFIFKLNVIYIGRGFIFYENKNVGYSAFSMSIDCRSVYRNTLTLIEFYVLKIILHLDNCS